MLIALNVAGGLVSSLVVVVTEIVAGCDAVMLDRLAGIVRLH